MNEKETGRYIVHLLLSLLKGQKPDEKPDQISFADVYEMAVKHNVCSMTLSAVDQLDNKPDQELYNQWNMKRLAAAAQGIVQINERDSILRAFEQNHIDSIPLKGCLMKDMYPKQEYREMSDLDILIHEDDQKKVRDIMESLGYTTASFMEAKDDSYRKPPFMHVEMHNRLFENVTAERLSIHIDPLLHPFDYAKNTGTGCRYELSWNDFYIYMIAHNAKHYLFAGCGIRQFIDLWVFRKTHEIDVNYVNSMLSMSKLKEFADQSAQLIDAWANNLTLSAELEEMEEIIFSAGSYGTDESRIRNHMRRAFSKGNKTRIQYLRYRVFPPYSLMKAAYPVLEKLPVLLPFCWIYRFVFKGIPDILKFLKEFTQFEKINTDE
ncbi:MAG: hypothetical protein E7194_01255 [Erysipelotrichaceae bacterium]|nr:hypothetical protein [Erysipelotrichaceae bacterium]